MMSGGKAYFPFLTLLYHRVSNSRQIQNKLDAKNNILCPPLLLSTLISRRLWQRPHCIPFPDVEVVFSTLTSAAVRVLFQIP